MAKYMTYNEIKQSLKNDETISSNSFKLLKEITCILNDHSNGRDNAENICRDLVFRALEHRSAFGENKKILDSLVRELGLFPYLEEENLSFMDSIAYEYHRPFYLREPLVFHREQAEIYRKLLDGNNIILSAPTSFGKSKIIDAIIASGKYRNIAIIVPTIALIDETRRRLSIFSDKFKLITQVSQISAEKNIFLFTAERVNVYENLPRIDFFVIDEFYKIDSMDTDKKRTVALNQAFYKLIKDGGQFYMLGPCVREIPEGFEQKYRCIFYPTTYSTVASDVVSVKKHGDNMDTLCTLVRTLQKESTLIFCKSPKSANDVVRALLNSGVTNETRENDAASTWMETNFHPEWILPCALRHRIGLHHGRLPRSLNQYTVRIFNEEKIRVLICTSTLIEGVNTKAKNVIIYDNTIAKKRIDFFTFNNIKGRSGRMFEYFVGRVFIFDPAPPEDLPFVDFPIYSQDVNTPNSLLIQIDNKDLSTESMARMELYHKQSDLPMNLLQLHSSIEPENLLNLAKNLKLQRNVLLNWNGFPKWDNLAMVCDQAWEYLIDGARAGIISGKQLAYKLFNLQNTPDIRNRIKKELEGDYAAENTDEAVERVFEFERTWASFEFPRILRAFSDIWNHVGGKCDYYFYAAKLESIFRHSFQIALEEFGVPIQVSDKFPAIFHGIDNIDEAIEVLKKIDISTLQNMDGFEKELLLDCKKTL